MLGQSVPGSYGNKGVHCIPQSSSITGSSPSDCLVSYPGHSLVGGGLTPLQRCSWCILKPLPIGPASLRMFSTKGVYQSYILYIYMYKQDLVLNNQQ